MHEHKYVPSESQRMKEFPSVISAAHQSRLSKPVSALMEREWFVFMDPI